MNTISKSHKCFSQLLRNPKVLTHPEEFLGPNYKEVLNFWMILDELSEEQLNIVGKRFVALYYENRSEWNKAANLTIEASKKVVGLNYAHQAGWAAYAGTFSDTVCSATRGLIGMHLILDQKPLTFFEMILEVLCQ